MTEPPPQWSAHGQPPRWRPENPPRVDPIELMHWRGMVGDTLGYQRGRLEDLERRLDLLEARRGGHGEASKLVIATLTLLLAVASAIVAHLLGIKVPPS